MASVACVAAGAFLYHLFFTSSDSLGTVHGLASDPVQLKLLSLQTHRRVCGEGGNPLLSLPTPPGSFQDRACFIIYCTVHGLASDPAQLELLSLYVFSATALEVQVELGNGKHTAATHKEGENNRSPFCVSTTSGVCANRKIVCSSKGCTDRKRDRPPHPRGAVFFFFLTFPMKFPFPTKFFFQGFFL